MSDPFFTTQWTRVIAAKGETEDARMALGELCESYYDPVVGFLRGEGRSDEDARELAHGFFAWLLSRDALASLSSLDPARTKTVSRSISATSGLKLTSGQKMSGRGRWEA